jgi:protoheme IX farnesyltransferase
MSARAATLTSTAGDLLALTKPRLSSLVLATTAGGMWLAPGGMSAPRALLTLFSVAAIIGAANALNCYLERDVDRFMKRTRNRPLPSGRMEPQVALWFSLSLAAVALPGIALGSNLLTAGLAALAFGTYVLLYTPLKARSDLAMFVGAIPGALPPLMGWTAVTNSLDLPGLVLFGVLFAWQIPHFLAIALYRRDEYLAAGLKSLPLVRGEAVSRIQIVAHVAVLIPVTVLLYPMHVAGLVYFVAALVLGAGFLGFSVYGAVKKLGEVWARQLFLVSLIYLTGLFLVLMADGHPRGA